MIMGIQLNSLSALILMLTVSSITMLTVSSIAIGNALRAKCYYRQEALEALVLTIMLRV